MASTSNHIPLLRPEISQKELPAPFPQATEDYSEILRYFGAEFTAEDYYWQVGEITRVQGWILHVSVIISQVTGMLKVVVPFLLEEGISFRIAQDKETAGNLLNGSLSLNQLGKVLCIYPDNDDQALQLSWQLLELTNPFKGPSIPTDIPLGGVLYTRYGAFNLILLADIAGHKDEYLYDIKGNLIKDPYPIPFVLPEGIIWPFGAIIGPVVPKPKAIFKHIYKPLFFLKRDTRGNVYKGIYMKGLIRTASCVIKQGTKNMVSEDSGRDIHDRLAWQQELHTELDGIVPLPKIFDHFMEDGDSYLVMEFIDGLSLYDRAREINFSSKSWFELQFDERKEILGYLLQIVSIIDRLHQAGYVHRDIAPGNFLINKKGQIYLIDMELSYSIRKGPPSPPFQFGTPGFMSPQQQEALTPTFEEDIYGLGALMVILFTGISPIRFNTADGKELATNLEVFIGSPGIARLISRCLAPDPADRPSLAILRNTLEIYQEETVPSSLPANNQKLFAKQDNPALPEIVRAALNGLTQAPIVQADDCWYSQTARINTPGAHTQREYSRYGGLHTGMGGVLYVLSRAKRVGFPLDACQKAYDRCWRFIDDEYIQLLPDITPGLYFGAAGIAVSLSQAIEAGLLEDDSHYREKMLSCLDLPNTNLDLSNGVSGQGVAVLQCARYLSEQNVLSLAGRAVSLVLNMQQKDGSWVLFENPEDKKGNKNVRFGTGITGIIWFLLHYQSRFPDRQVQDATVRALKWLLKRTGNLKELYNRKVFKEKILQGPEMGDERKGILLTFIKAYEVLGSIHYKIISEEALMKYPAFMVKTNFTQDTGLAGLGELYLEAHRVFKNQEWMQRALWIADVFQHTFFRNADGSGHWLMEENYNATADLMVGGSGIVNFLLRCLYPAQLGYRLIG